MAPKEDAAQALKRKAETAGASPAAKVAKEEAETDAEEDKRAAIKETVAFEPNDTTLNVIPTMGGKMLMMLSEGGMQYLLAGARANVGVKSGRYMFEVRMVESLASAAPLGGGRSPSLVKHLVRIGFSLGGSSHFLCANGEAEVDGVCFDSDGFYYAPAQKKKETAGSKFGKDNVVSCVLNLDKESPNANTVSLFMDGVRVSPPMKLPECLEGKTLFPHVSFRNCSVQLNFGPAPLAALPFKCTTWQNAASADAEVTPASTPKDGKYEVVFPVGVPDQGTFPWLDEFAKQNPNHVELSDRKIVEWAQKSGLWKPKGTSWKSSNDRPEFNFGIAALDDISPRKVIQIVAPLVPRNYLVMEVRGNLMPAIRKENLKRFRGTQYKRIAKVVVGEPNGDYTQKIMASLLKEKQDKLSASWKVRKAEKERKKQIAQRQKQLAETRKATEEAAKKKKAEDAKKKAEIAEKKKQDLADKKAAKEAEEAEKKAAEEAENGEEKTEEEKKAAEEAKAEADAKKAEDKAAAELKAEEEKKAAEEEAAEEEKQAVEEKKAEEEKKAKEAEEEKKKEAEDDEDMEPVAELSEEEKKQFFPKRDNSDLTSATLASSFADFALPGDDEGFTQIDYVWGKQNDAAAYLKSWVNERKISIKIEDLQPSDWFKTRLADFQTNLTEWQSQQKAFKSDAKKMGHVKRREAIEKGEAKEEKKDEEEKKEDDAAEGEEKDEEAEKKKEEAVAEKKRQAEEDAAEDAKPHASKIDVYKSDDVADLGNGEPMFLNFAFEDWALLTLRFELVLLAKAFLHDTGDAERVGIHESHLSFYYNKYFKKSLNTKFYGADTNTAIVGMVKDAVKLDEKLSVLLSLVADAAGEDAPAPMDILVKMTEEVRRERQRRIDAGDDTARLKFNVMHAGKSDKEPVKSGLVTPRPKGGAYGTAAGGAAGNQWKANAAPAWGNQSWGGKGGKGKSYW